MAKLTMVAPYHLQAETAWERRLLDYARVDRGRVVLEGAYFRVYGQSVLLPETASAALAQRLLIAFERAALSHAEAESRRQRFRIA